MLGSSNSDPIRVDTPSEDGPTFPEGQPFDGDEDYLLSDGGDVSSKEEDYLLLDDGYASEEEDVEEDNGEERAEEVDKPSNEVVGLRDPRVPPSWNPAELDRLSRDELVANVCQLEQYLRKTRDDYIDEENGRHFDVERAREVLQGMEEMEKAYQALFHRVRCLKSKMACDVPAH